MLFTQPLGSKWKCSFQVNGERAFVPAMPALCLLCALQHLPAALRLGVDAFASLSVSSGYFIFIK